MAKRCNICDRLKPVSRFHVDCGDGWRSRMLCGDCKAVLLNLGAELE